jgi:transcriptional regulator with PAS, ATPase and Fis domain
MIVLIDGETGTGKDLLAQYIHGKSRRSRRPFVVVNCSSLQKNLLESELFGHKRGSFTGAYREHRGLFSAAGEGTLFLDEIGELDGALQSRILRTIETKRIRAVGAAIEETVNVRLICATSRDLPQMVRDKLFREDLYFRLNQFRIHLPPLRERGEDIEFLAHFFLEKYKARYPEKEVTDFHPESLRLMALYDWPGNVRELSSVVHRAVVSAKNRVAVVDVQAMEKTVQNFEDATRSYQKNLVLRALDLAGGNKDRAAKLLGIHRSTIFRYLEQSE